MAMSPLNKRLLQIAGLTTFYAIYLPVLFPSLRLAFHAPLIVSLFHRKPLNFSLFTAMACGLFLDIQSSQRFGFYAVNYLITSWIVYRQQRHFFEDQLSTIALMTFCFSFISTSLAWTQRYFSDAPIRATWTWIGSDLMLYPIIDGFYALTAVILPILWHTSARRHRRHQSE